MLSTNIWPQMDYLTCSTYTGSNTPKRTLDLKSSFINNTERASYGSFSFADNDKPFNGFSTVKFNMDILSVTIDGGKQTEKLVGNWASGFNSSLVIKPGEHLPKPQKIYRVCTVLVSFAKNPNFFL